MKGAIIYISSNREDPKFEGKIISSFSRTLDGLVDNAEIEMDDLPTYSVTQKPMGLDNNVCVGNVGVSGFNFCRQLQMVVELAKVDYVISCEADCLYSPDYFTFIPPKLDRVYRNTNNYVLPYKKDYWYRKDSQTAFQVAGRDFLLNRLNYLLKDQPVWDTEMKNFPKEIGKPFLEEWDTFKTKYACFQIKTGDSMRKQTRHEKESIGELPYWGTAKEVREKYL